MEMHKHRLAEMGCKETAARGVCDFPQSPRPAPSALAAFPKKATAQCPLLPPQLTREDEIGPSLEPDVGTPNYPLPSTANSPYSPPPDPTLFLTLMYCGEIPCCSKVAKFREAQGGNLPQWGSREGNATAYLHIYHLLVLSLLFPIFPSIGHVSVN